jgi:type I restriction enzyme S subunit
MECGGNDAALAGHALNRAPGAAPSTGRAEEGELPEGWRSTPFTETLCPEKPRVTKVQQSNYRKSGRFPIIDQGQTFIAGYWDSENDVYREHLPVIVFGDHTRVFKFVDVPFVAGADGTHVLVPDTRRFDPFLLYLALSSLDIPSRSYNRHFRLLKDRSVVTPPLPEQQAIASVLRTVQGAKAVCEHVLAATRQLKQSLLHHLFTYGPVPFLHAAHIPLKTEIGPMPEHWQTAELGDFTLHSAFGPRFGGELYDQAGNVATLRTTDISDDGRINYATMPRARITEERFQAHFLNKGDFLVTRSGTCGVASVFEGFGIPVLAGAFLIRFMLKDGLSPYFLRDYFNSPIGRPRVESMASGAVQKNISGTSLKAFVVPVPPLREQGEIAAELAAVDAKLAAEESRHSALAALFQSLLHYLMTGKVRLSEFVGRHAPL